ncbi:Ribokinase-like protein [Paraphysoderma sedebokerense]|nr:Ribokinase-like protein [Paraphysoderma sedebokerense]
MIETVQIVSLARFIIDDLYFVDGTRQEGVLGGGGLHAIMGMRPFLPAPHQSKSIGFVCHIGSDCPESVLKKLSTLNISLRLIKHPTSKTPRAINKFEPDGYRSFTLLTPKEEYKQMGTTVDDLTDDFLKAKVFHLLTNPKNCCVLVKELKRKREKLGLGNEKVYIVFEPTPEGFDLDKDYFEAMSLVDIITPNHEEAERVLKSYSNFDPSFRTPNVSDLNNILTTYIQLYHRHYPSPASNPAFIIRAAERGCLVSTPTLSKPKWFPPYQDDSSKVVDTTGAGNSFCGGLCVGLVECNGDVERAVKFGVVSASLTIEQVGFAECSLKDGIELWNGETVRDRLRRYHKRLYPTKN